MPKVLFVATHRPDRSPSQRFRYEQYIEFLNKNDWETDVSFLITEKYDRFFYKEGHFLKKLGVLLKSTLIRVKDVLRASKYDVIFIQREAFLTGSTIFERWFKQSKAKIIFDFDDSIWLSNVSDANKKWNWLKNPDKTKKIIGYSDLIFAGNDYLATYAKQYNSNVVIIPTTIDTHEYTKDSNPKHSDIITIGWSGSITTIQHFEFALPFLTKLKEKYNEKISIKVVGDGNYLNKNLDINGLPWIKEDEVKELSTFDIGIMPLPDDEWAKGKCGLKGLQYMALGIPTIMSPVGVNSEIIQDGDNGYLANQENEWVDKISSLIESKELRNKIGKNGLLTIKNKYSVEANKSKYLSLFNQLIK